MMARVVALVAMGLLGWLALMPATAQTVPDGRLPSPALVKLQEEAAALYKSGRFAEALAASERTLAATRAEFGNDHEQVSIQLFGLGLVAERAGRFDIAERAYRENLRIGDIVYGKDSAFATQVMEQLAGTLIALGRPGEAEALLQRALAIRVGLLGGDNSWSASTHAGLGAVSLAKGDTTAALKSYREAVRLLTGKRESQTLAAHVMQNEIRRQLSAFTGLIEAAWQERARNPAMTAALADEGFAASQRAWSTSAASALARMSARIAAGPSPLGQRIRRQQDAAERVLALHQEDNRELTRWSEIQRKDATYSTLLERFRQASIAQHRKSAPDVKRQTDLVADLQAHLARCPPGQKKSGCESAERERNAITRELSQLSAASSAGAGDLMAIHREMEAAEARLPGHAAFQAARKARIDEQVRLDQVVQAERKAIVAQFPDYLALTEPAPLTIAETRAALMPDEALVTVLVGKSASYVWAISRDRADWARMEAGADVLAGHVAALRNALDPLSAPPAPGAAPAFDLDRAYAVYRLVLGPVERALAGKKRLILVPTGPLTSLPFHVLVTEPPRREATLRDTLRSAAWLARRHATSVLPSVPSLTALRRTGQSVRAAEPFLGIGDPALVGPGTPQGGQARAAAVSVASIYRNGKADLRAVRELAPLPETAAELRAIADAMKAPDTALLLRHDATETRIRNLPLDRYRVVHFATHGLVAGELSGLEEPALVLTPPLRPSDENDGLLTASEVAALRLDADWVVLSACNTAAGAEVGAEALSGLARAFFFAGARAMLVSHWAVNSEATVWLTTRTFEALAADKRLGRAEAFRRTMLAMIDAGQPPSFWAPFEIVGEGAAR